MSDLELLKQISKKFTTRIIAYRKEWSEITAAEKLNKDGSIRPDLPAGILLSQLLFWFEKMNKKEFNKSDPEFAEELGMGVSQLKGARKRLEELGLIETNQKGWKNKMHYIIHIKPLIYLFSVWNDIQSTEKIDTKKKLVSRKDVTSIKKNLSKYKEKLDTHYIDDNNRCKIDENNNMSPPKKKPKNDSSTEKKNGLSIAPMLDTYRSYINSPEYKPSKDELPKFIQAMKQMDKFYAQGKRHVIKVENRISYLFKALDLAYGNSDNIIQPGHLCSKNTWDKIMPQFIKRNFDL